MPLLEHKFAGASLRPISRPIGSEDESSDEIDVWGKSILFKCCAPSRTQWFFDQAFRPRLEAWREPRRKVARGVLRDDIVEVLRGMARAAVSRASLPAGTERAPDAIGSTPKNISEAIEASRWILGLGDDWDEQGSPGYSEETFRRASDFLSRQAQLARGTFGRELPAPKILPGPDGSIDLHWKMRRFELLVNIPSDLRKPATFYGDDYADFCIRGNLSPFAETPGLIVWLMH